MSAKAAATALPQAPQSSSKSAGGKGKGKKDPKDELDEDALLDLACQQNMVGFSFPESILLFFNNVSSLFCRNLLTSKSIDLEQLLCQITKRSQLRKNLSQN